MLASTYRKFYGIGLLAFVLLYIFGGMTIPSGDRGFVYGLMFVAILWLLILGFYVYIIIFEFKYRNDHFEDVPLFDIILKVFFILLFVVSVGILCYLYLRQQTYFQSTAGIPEAYAIASSLRWGYITLALSLLGLVFAFTKIRFVYLTSFVLGMFLLLSLTPFLSQASVTGTFSELHNSKGYDAIARQYQLAIASNNVELCPTARLNSPAGDALPYNASAYYVLQNKLDEKCIVNVAVATGDVETCYRLYAPTRCITVLAHMKNDSSYCSKAVLCGECRNIVAGKAKFSDTMSYVLNGTFEKVTSDGYEDATCPENAVYTHQFR